jgi:RNA polymerase sigma-70 factor (ECF subfamily)
MRDERLVELQRAIDRLVAGDDSARELLLEVASARLHVLSHDLLRGDRVHRWEETDDVMQEAMIRLHQSLAEVKPATVRDFLRLAAFQIRRVLVDFARRYYGPHGLAAAHLSDGVDRVMWPSPHHHVTDSTPSKIAGKSEDESRLYQAVGELPDEEREVTEVIWFHGMTQQDAATVIGVSERTVRRRWQRARLMLFEALREGLSDDIS